MRKYLLFGALALTLTLVAAPKLQASSVVTWFSAVERNTYRFIVDAVYTITDFEGTIVQTGTTGKYGDFQTAFPRENIGQITVAKVGYTLGVRNAPIPNVFNYIFLDPLQGGPGECRGKCQVAPAE